jgi:tRNA threonylcarbamoyladenosine biosynthesis protein TsaB
VTLIGFDTSLATTSACVLRGDGEAFHTPPPDPQRLLGPARHSQELLPELERLLAESGTAWDDVESIAVGVGPGTFTGLRIGVATARALGQALGVDLRPVSSLETLAAAAAGALPQERSLLSLIDARRGQVFCALYERAAANGRGLEPVWQPEVLDPESLVTRIGQLDPSPVCFGDWAIKSRSGIEDAGANVPPSESGLHAVSALHLCKLAMGEEAVSPADVYPVYLRLPDAEINRQLALGTNTDDSQDR